MKISDDHQPNLLMESDIYLQCLVFSPLLEPALMETNDVSQSSLFLVVLVCFLDSVLHFHLFTKE